MSACRPWRNAPKRWRRSWASSRRWRKPRLRTSAVAMRTSGTSDSSADGLIEHAYRLLALAKALGAEEAEVFGICGRSVDVDLRKSEVELASESFHRGLGLRAVVRGAVGFSSTS